MPKLGEMDAPGSRCFTSWSKGWPFCTITLTASESWLRSSRFAPGSGTVYMMSVSAASPSPTGKVTLFSTSPVMGA